MKKIKLILTSLLVLFLLSCDSKEFIVLIEQPTQKELDNIPIGLTIDENTFYTDKLKQVNVVPTHREAVFKLNDSQNYMLKVTVNEKEFKYPIKYPDEKYIIVSPFYKDGEIGVGILKQKDKFLLQ